MNAIKTENWSEVKIHFGKKAGTRLGDLSPRDLEWWKKNWRPDSKYCKSKLTETFEIPSHETDDGYEDDDGSWISCDKYTVPASVGTRRVSDPVNCVDCALRAAFDAAEIEPTVNQIVAGLGIAVGNTVGAVGEKLTVAVTVGVVKEFETEFNRKKVVQNSAYFSDAGGNLFYWKSGSMPAEIVEGAYLKLTGTVKEHFTNHDNCRVTALTRCKVEGAVKLVATRHITLFCDAKSANDQFAFCGADGNVIEFGSLGLGSPDNGDNSKHEIEAALRAFDFARKVKEAAKLDCIELDFRFDAQWLTGMVGMAKPLRDFAKQHKLLVKMNWISGTENPADAWTTASGSREFSGDLASLAVEI